MSRKNPHGAADGHEATSAAAPTRRVRPPGAAADALIVFTGVMLLTGLLPSLPPLPTDVVSLVTRIGFEPLTDYARYAAAALSALAMYALDCRRVTRQPSPAGAQKRAS